jgi:hypothetical protein
MSSLNYTSASSHKKWSKEDRIKLINLLDETPYTGTPWGELAENFQNRSGTSCYNAAWNLKRQGIIYRCKNDGKWHCNRNRISHIETNAIAPRLRRKIQPDKWRNGEKFLFCYLISGRKEFQLNWVHILSLFPTRSYIECKRLLQIVIDEKLMMMERDVFKPCMNIPPAPKPEPNPEPCGEDFWTDLKEILGI